VSPTPTPRDNNFNLLRLLLAALVIFSHSFALTGGMAHRGVLAGIIQTNTLGNLAVEGFFLISGYLIVQSWQSNPRLLVFLRNRVLRIYPAFIFASLLCALVVGPLGSNAAAYFSQFDPWHFLQGMLLLKMPVVPPVFEGQTYPLINGSMWTIEYEFRCYLFAALAGVCGMFYLRRYWAAVAVGVFGIALACIVEEVPDRIHAPAWMTFLTINPVFFINFLAFFCAGGCFWIFRDTARYKTIWALAAIIIVIPCMFSTKTAGVAVAIVGTYGLFRFAGAQFSWLARFRTCPDISYGVYLYGWPAQKMLLWYLPTLSAWQLFPAALAASCLLGWLSWHAVERPFMRLKRRAGQPDMPPPVPAMR